MFTSADTTDPTQGRAKPPGPAPGFNLYGYLSASLGLGVAARNTATALLGRGLATRLTDVYPGGGMQGADHSFAEKIARDVGSPALGVNLFHINPDQIVYLLRPGGTVTIDGRLAVADDGHVLPLAGFEQSLARALPAFAIANAEAIRVGLRTILLQ